MKKILLILFLAVFSIQLSAQKLVKEISQQQFYKSVGTFNADGNLKVTAKLPVVVDFNATWCGPCRRLAPTLEKLAEEYKGKVDFYSIDVDKNKPLALKVGASSIPYVLFISPNGYVEVMVGLQDEPVVRSYIENALAK